MLSPDKMHKNAYKLKMRKNAYKLKMLSPDKTIRYTIIFRRHTLIVTGM